MTVDLDKRYQTMVVLWVGSFLSTVALYLISTFVVESAEAASQEPAQSTLILWILTAVGVVTVAVSLLLKRKLLQRSVDQQSVEVVQQALVVGVALSEIPALAGVLETMFINSGFNYLLFIIAGIGALLHFPRRDNLLAATYKSSLDRVMQ